MRPPPDPAPAGGGRSATSRPFRRESASRPVDTVRSQQRRYTHAQGDRSDLAAIDARFTVAGYQAFSFIGTAAFTGVAGQLHYWHESGRTIVSGNGTADFHITLTGNLALVSGDFVL